jgi:trans-aconitate methyltransferase
MQNIIQKIFPPRKIPEKTIENLTQEISAFSELQKLCKSLDEPTIFDVGAHIGQTANEFRRRFPKARIFSFEPFPNSFQTLSANF